MTLVSQSERSTVPMALCRLTQRIVQIHPTLACNLHCSHCYSSSGPNVAVSLDAETVKRAICDAADMGYRVVAISGGEPLAYAGLGSILTHAKACGMTTVITTNGTLLNDKRLDQLGEFIDLMAISLDGPPDIHNEIRQSPTAFDRMLAGVESVRKSRVRHGFIFTVTRASWEHVLWVAEFANDHGARLLQLHPLESTGRAKLHLRGCAPDDDLLARVYLLALALMQKYAGSMAVQFDVLSRDCIKVSPQLVYGIPFHSDELQNDPAALLNLLVIEADGTVVPFSYGFGRRYAVGNVRQQRLADAWRSYVSTTYEQTRHLCYEVFEELLQPSELPFFNWYELMVQRSLRAALSDRVS